MLINLTISNRTVISPLPRDVAMAIRPMLTLESPQYKEAARRGYSVRNIPKHIICYRQGANVLEVPRGFTGQLKAVLGEMGHEVNIIDRTRSFPPLGLKFQGELRGYQEEAVGAVIAEDFSVLCAPTGSGKTVMALAAAALKDQPFAVEVHTRELLDQWVERIKQFLGISPGVVANGKFNMGREATVCLVQTLYKNPRLVASKVGLLIPDEVHRSPARIFREAISSFDCQSMLGISATPYRADGLTDLIHWYVGPTVHEVGRTGLERGGAILRALVIPRDTGVGSRVQLAPPKYSENFDPNVEYGSYGQIISELVANRERNLMIARDVAGEADNGTCLALTDRKDHARELAEIISGLGEPCECLTGDSTDRQGTVERLNSGVVRAVVATGQLIGEGFDCRNLYALFLTMPVKGGRNDSGGRATRLIQYLGRVLRPAPGKEQAVIYDYRDNGVPVLMRAWKSRAREYRELGWEIRSK